MSRVLVTGGTGMVGKHLKEVLPDATYIGSGVDLRDWTSTNILFNKIKPTHVVHLEHVYIPGYCNGISHEGREHIFWTSCKDKF